MFDSSLAAAAAARARSQQMARQTPSGPAGGGQAPPQAVQPPPVLPALLQGLPPQHGSDRLHRLGRAIGGLSMNPRPASAPQASQGANLAASRPAPSKLSDQPLADLLPQIDDAPARRADVSRELVRRLQAAGVVMPASRQGPRETIALMANVDWLVLVSEGHVNISEALDAVTHVAGLPAAEVPTTDPAAGAQLSARTLHRIKTAVEINLRRIARDNPAIREMVDAPSPGAPPVTGSGSTRR